MQPPSTAVPLTHVIQAVEELHERQSDKQIMQEELD